MFDPRIEKHLITDQGEHVVDEVRKHWAASVSAVLELFGGIVVLLLSFFVPAQAWWVPALLGAAVTGHAIWRYFEQHTDRFVITNMRVFRVHGILSQRIATMPLARILDISVYKPVVGRVFGYGHFVFESAAQDQGFREIRWVSRPDDRDLTIQRVIQRTGLRAAASVDVLEGDEDSDDDGTGPIGMDSAQEVISTVAPSAPAHHARPAPAAPTGPRSIFNSDRGNWTDDGD